MVAGGSVELIAGQSIRLLPGLSVMPGGYLHARIATGYVFCSTLLSQMPRDDVCGEEQLKAAVTGKGDESVFTLYPNPGSGYFTIEVGPRWQGRDLRLEVYTFDGRLLAVKSFEAAPTQGFYLPGQKKGMYLIRLVNGNKWAVVRYILW